MCISSMGGALRSAVKALSLRRLVAMQVCRGVGLAAWMQMCVLAAWVQGCVLAVCVYGTCVLAAWVYAEDLVVYGEVETAALHPSLSCATSMRGHAGMCH